MWVEFLLLVSASATLGEGRKVLNVKANSVDNVKRVHELADLLNLDVWHYPRNLEDAFHILIPQEYEQSFDSWLADMGVESMVMVEDVDKLIEEERVSIQLSRKSSSFLSFNFESYNSYNDIYQYLQNLEASTNEVYIETHDIGKTDEGRPIPVIKLSSIDGDAPKSIFMDCGIHAREWIAPAFCMYVINQLTEPANREMLGKYNWYIVPVLNPDGYAYSFISSGTRLWRKNRNVNANSTCLGVDLNRNFGFKYNPDIGGSENPCSDTYTGTGPFSEAESKAVSNYILELLTHVDFDVYLTIHSYGQMWLYPWGYTSDLPSDWKELDSVAQIACDALRSVHGKRYRIGSSTNVLYSAAGGSDDWAKGGANITYSYTLELRDTGRYNFLLPADQIKPTCEETWDGLKAMVNVLRK